MKRPHVPLSVRVSIPPAEAVRKGSRWRASVAGMLATLAWLPGGMAQSAGAEMTLAKGLGEYVAKPSDEAERARAGLKLPAGLRAEIWATHPLLADPVALSFDGRGRLYVAEHHRNRHGTEDDREHRYWLDDDFAAQTVGDRLAFMEKWAAAGKKPMRFFTEIPDRLVCVEDRDGDGRAETTRTLALFGDPLDGANVGVLARDGNVWVTCIPNLWKFRDDGRAEMPAGEKVFSGFGVKFSLHGHDMHGLVMGPDGRLYWSIGDRGFNVKSREGGVVKDLWRGAVFRCEPDGSKLEVFCTGLRNPQEIVFDDLGNLITVDNDNDAAEESPRVLHLVEGGNYGWHSGNIWPDDTLSPLAPRFRRPWFEDGLWQARFPEQPAWVMPPVGHLANGPCGLTREPGVTLMPEAWRGSYFVTDWRGGKSSPVIRFTLEKRGNGFAVQETEEFLNGVLPTDVEFGPDGRLYVSDMVGSEPAPGGGRRTGRGAVFALATDAPAAVREDVARMKGWFAEGFGGVATDELIRRLGHGDYRVRLEAQLALAQRDDARAALETTARREGGELHARVHALQALGQLQRRTGRGLEAVVSLLGDPDGEVRAQVARQLADTPVAGTEAALLRQLQGATPRARFFAAMALSRLGAAVPVAAVAGMLRENADADPYLRHAGVMALTRTSATSEGRAAVAKLADDRAASVRLAVLLTWRRTGDTAVAKYLTDAEPRLVREAVRAIHDLRMESVLPRLAELSNGLATLDNATGRRVLNARFRLGRSEDATALANVAAADGVSNVLRCEALALLADWPKPAPRDRVTGEWAPLAARTEEAAVAALRGVLRALIQKAPAEVVAAAVGVAGRFGIAEGVDAVLGVAGDAAQSEASRIAAAGALVFLPDPRTLDVAKALAREQSPALRAAGRALWFARDVESALPELAEVFRHGELREQQAAALTLGGSTERRAYELLTTQADAAVSGKLAPGVALDVFDAMARGAELSGLNNGERTRRQQARAKRVAAWTERYAQNDPLREHRWSLEGGDALRGRELFHQKVEIQCVRCHRIEGQGNSDVGPDLTGIGARKPREYLLRAIVDPSAELAPGFEYVALKLADGRAVDGLVQAETVDELRVAAAGDKASVVRVRKSDVRERKATSPMPPLAPLMTARELRDVVEYLASGSSASR